MGSSLRLTLFSFLFLVGFAFSMWTGYLVYRFGPRNNTNRYFILTMLSVSLYLFSAFVVYNLPLGIEAMAWERIGFVGAIMFPALFLHFMLYFPERNELSGRAKIVMFTVTTYMLFLIILVPGNRLLVDLHEKNFFRYCSVGNLYFLYLIYLIAVNFSAIAYATWKYFHLNDITSKRRIGLVLLAATIAILGSFVETRPLIGNNFVPVTSITTSAMSLIIGYAIVHYGAFDVERLVQEGIIISLGTALASVFYILFILILSLTFLSMVGISTMAISSSFVVVMILAFQPFKESIDNFIQRRFFENINHYRGVIEQLSQSMTHNLNLVDLSNIIVQTIRDNIGLTQAFVSLYKPENEHNHIISSTNISLVNTVLHRNDDKFATEENLVGKKIYWENLDVKKTGIKNSFYSKLDGEKILTFPLQAKHKLIGYLGLGLKLNNQKFYDSERRLLVALAHQAAIAVDNAQLYRTMVI